MMTEPDTTNTTRTERLLDLMDQISRRTRHIVPDQWPEVELTMPQLRTLMILEARPYRMSDIAEQIGSSYSATTAMIDRLVEKTLVERVHSTVDRRVITCQLTTEGHTALDKIWGMQRSGVQRLAQAMCDDDVDTVIRAMEIMIDAAGRLDKSSYPEDEAG